MKKSVVLASIFALAVTASAQSNLSLPAGTAVKMKLETTLATFTSKQGDEFSGRVTEAVVQTGRTVIPVGATVQGTVGKVTEPRRIAGRPTITLYPHTVVMPDGERFHLNATVVDTDRGQGTDVTEEGAFKGNGRDMKDNVEIGMGAAGGGIIGGLAGGAKGVFIGGAIGATATAVHWLSKKRSAVLPAGTELTMELNRATTMRAAQSGGQ
jgi:hypothetical protein